MNAEIFKIMILAAIPLLIIEIFIGVDYFGVSRRFDAILTAMTYATVGFLLFGELMAACGYIFEGSAHDYNCVGRAVPGYSGCDP